MNAAGPASSDTPAPSDPATPTAVPAAGEAPAPAPATAPAAPVSAFAEEKAATERLLTGRTRIEAELAKVIVGQRVVVEQILISLLAGGHCLITGAPGLAKTLLVKSIAQVFHLNFRRIQFTPDLMPADVTGTEILQESGGERRMTFVRGPIFAHMLLADEINRTPPKTQAALLEAMQEHQVTAGGVRHALEEPFFVLATQNPIEMEGTYPLPEAQLDRFMFNVVMDYLPEDDEVRVVTQTTRGRGETIQPLFDGADVLRFHQLVRSVPIAEEMVRYAVRLASASRPRQAGTPGFINDWVNWGAGTRAGQFLVLGAKARALLQGRAFVSIDDLQALAAPTLRHRILLNYRAEAEGIRVDDVVQKLLATVKAPV
ncbi:MAG: MoxR family ATPase [Opitutaceae bacterium]|nr:MoxR family ATPase [Opitutaceae bacterium]